jgi:hypothetical protein
MPSGVPLACQRSRSSGRWCHSRGVLPRARAPVTSPAIFARCHAPAELPGRLLCCPPSPRCPVPGRYAVTPDPTLRSALRSLCHRYQPLCQLRQSCQSRCQSWHRGRLGRAAASPDHGAVSHRQAPGSGPHRPRLVGVAVRGRVNVRSSCSPPLGADRDWRQTGEHLSPARGIWCSNQLNTMSAHGIPSDLPVDCGRSHRPARGRPRITSRRSLGQVPGRNKPTMSGRGVSAGMDRNRAWVVDAFRGAYVASGTRFAGA